MTTDKQLREEWPIVFWALVLMTDIAVMIAVMSFLSSRWVAKTMDSTQQPTHQTSDDQLDLPIE